MALTCRDLTDDPVRQEELYMVRTLISWASTSYMYYVFEENPQRKLQYAGCFSLPFWAVWSHIRETKAFSTDAQMFAHIEECAALFKANGLPGLPEWEEGKGAAKTTVHKTAAGMYKDMADIRDAYVTLLKGLHSKSEK